MAASEGAVAFLKRSNCYSFGHLGFLFITPTEIDGFLNAIARSCFCNIINLMGLCAAVHSTLQIYVFFKILFRFNFSYSILWDNIKIEKLQTKLHLHSQDLTRRKFARHAIGDYDNIDND